MYRKNSCYFGPIFFIFTILSLGCVKKIEQNETPAYLGKKALNRASDLFNSMQTSLEKTLQPPGDNKFSAQNTIERSSELVNSIQKQIQKTMKIERSRKVKNLVLPSIDSFLGDQEQASTKTIIENSEIDLGLMSGHVRFIKFDDGRFLRISPAQSDPFILLKTEGVHHARTWHWKIINTYDKPNLVGISRYRLNFKEAEVNTEQLDFTSSEKDDSLESETEKIIIEHWTIPEIGFETENIYKYANNGKIISLSQRFHPEFPRIEMIKWE